MKKVLLHICCSSCASVCIGRLKSEDFKVYGIFYNPNIQPEEEYLRRKKDLEILKREYPLEIINCQYNKDSWFNFVEGHEDEPEGQGRCRLCFEFRLKEVYASMLKNNLDYFTTTLTISPHKKSRLINELGLSIGADKFLVRDFKKEDGFKESIKLSRELGLYRQSYCGCVYSNR